MCNIVLKYFVLFVCTKRENIPTSQTLLYPSSKPAMHGLHGSKQAKFILTECSALFPEGVIFSEIASGVFGCIPLHVSLPVESDAKSVHQHLGKLEKSQFASTCRAPRVQHINVCLFCRYRCCAHLVGDAESAIVRSAKFIVELHIYARCSLICYSVE